jgi:hypothetical protein
MNQALYEHMNNKTKMKKKKKKNEFSQVPVAHSNPSFSGGRSQEDRSSKPAQANSSQDPISKNPSQKKAGGVA